MSKKINISIPNKVRPNLINLFHEYTSRKVKERSIARNRASELHLWGDDDEYSSIVDYWDRVFPGWDDDGDDYLVDDDVSIVYPISNGKKGKNKKDDVYSDFWEVENTPKRGKKKHNKKRNGRCRVMDINTPYSGEECDYDFNDVYDEMSARKEIWFYPDYHDENDRLEFNSLKEFSDYCDSMCYYVDKDVLVNMIWRYESHCCINPETKGVGLLEIVSEDSYGNLFYEVCDAEELGKS